MGWNTDPELQELFRAELADRVARLRAGAEAMQEGAVNSETSGVMLREGHTIKGTARVMGFAAISRAGQALEQVWRRIQHGDLEPRPELGEVLGAVADALPDAVEANPEEGTGELTAAISRLNRVLSGEGFDPPPTAPAPDGDRGEARTDADAPSDLGGLLGALETWADEEAIRVNAGRLYRLINDIAAARIDIEAARGMGMHLLGMVEHRSPETADEATALVEALDGLEKMAAQLQQNSLDLAASPLREITNTLPQLVNYLAKKTGKEIRFELVGDDLSVDRQILERIAEPLRQLIVNAIEHGIETPPERERAGKPPTATLRVRITVVDHRLQLEVADDGRGIDWDAVARAALRRGLLPPDRAKDPDALRSLLFAPGFTTVVESSELVGDGTGLTSVAAVTEMLYGSISLDTEPGRGTTVTLTVPTTRALQRAVLVIAAGLTWGIPETAIIEIASIEEVEILAGPRQMEMVRDGQRIPVASFAASVGLVEKQDLRHVIVVSGPMGSIGLSVPTILGDREVVAKELGPLLAGPLHLTGAALLGGGDVVLLVDPNRLAERAREVPNESGPRSRVLVVDDSPGARQVVAGVLASNGFDTTIAGGVADAIACLADAPYDALVVDYSMPEADGISLVAEVRERFGALPIVMLSGVATPADQSRARAAGVDAYFDKADFREGALASTLRSLIAAQNARAEVLQR
jgi:two-component system chemotaxis sensor kinase CheA